MAVVPLLIWPVAVAVRRFWSSWTIRALTVSAIVLSLDAALTYNWHHEKAMGALRASGASGWRPNLAFPVMRDAGWESPGNFALFLALAGLVVAAAVVAWFRSAGPTSRPASAWAAPSIVVAAGAVMSVAMATTATAFNGDWFRDDYLVGEATARRVAAAISWRSSAAACV